MRLVQHIVEEVANREGRLQTDLPPLYESLDPDALEQLLESAGETPMIIEFDYDEYRVRVGSDGTVDVLR